MRRRLRTATFGVTTVALIWLGAVAAGAQTPPDEDQATGPFTENGRTGVFAQFQRSNPGSGTHRSVHSNIICRFYSADLDRQGEEIGGSQLLTEYDAAVAEQRRSVSVYRSCTDGNEIVSAGLIQWSPSVGTALVPPTELRDTALNWVYYPPPAGDTLPSLGAGTFAQLDTYFWIVPEIWQVQSARATAGTVWAEVTATPVHQEWAIRDYYRGQTYTVSCDGRGVEFTPAAGTDAPEGACVWTNPPHSSAAQATTYQAPGPASGEPCFPATVTITWERAWNTNAPGVAGDVITPNAESTASTCIVVQEIQAVVTDG